MKLWNDLDRSKKYIFGNWKMHKNIAETKEFFAKGLKNTNAAKVVAGIATPYTDLAAAIEGANKGTVDGAQNIYIGSENVAWAADGAFTGEISLGMLQELGIEFAIIGHSERRTMFGETDKTVNEKAKVLLAGKVVPIICCGEDINVYEKGETNKFIGSQIKAAFEGISAEDATHAIIAYEPMWAIGSGKTATPEIAENVCKFIRSTLADMYSADVANKIVIQYGGSVKPANVADIMSQPDIDGALIGGASLDPTSFEELMNFNK